MKVSRYKVFYCYNIARYLLLKLLNHTCIFFYIEMICYRDLGCFRDEGPFDYLDTLPGII